MQGAIWKKKYAIVQWHNLTLTYFARGASRPRAHFYCEVGAVREGYPVCVACVEG